MDINKIKKLIRLLQKSEITEIEVHEGDESIRVSRAAAPPRTTAVTGPDNKPEQKTNNPSGGGDASTTLTAAAEATGKRAGQIIVTSPMVGVFYSAREPDTPPLVQSGQKIKSGDVLCIIEAMKIMNPIEAERDGTVREVMVENGSPVEYGQPLFVLDTA